MINVDFQYATETKPSGHKSSFDHVLVGFGLTVQQVLYNARYVLCMTIAEANSDSNVCVGEGNCNLDRITTPE
jgi:hypothetical protein